MSQSTDTYNELPYSDAGPFPATEVFNSFLHIAAHGASRPSGWPGCPGRFSEVTLCQGQVRDLTRQHIRLEGGIE
jgi:hypothetical protein